ncbi:hypothetical protein ACLKA6_018644 [Drosophila palustris]
MPDAEMPEELDIDKLIVKLLCTAMDEVDREAVVYGDGRGWIVKLLCMAMDEVDREAVVYGDGRGWS